VWLTGIAGDAGGWEVDLRTDESEITSGAVG
jgi:hypothetical protein